MVNLQWRRPSDKREGEGGGGSSHPDPGIKGGCLKKNFFRPFGPQFGVKIRGDPPLDPPSTYASTLIQLLFNPLSPKSDQHQTSPCNVNAL